MPERTYTTIDKSAWPRGPWDTEPDKIQWIDATTGLDCLIVRTPGGHLCGYVGVGPGHSWHGIDYGDCVRGSACDRVEHEPWCDHRPDYMVDVHGGLTFSADCQESADPSTGICHVPEPGRPDDVWWFGFDCAHASDLSPADAHSFRYGDPVYRDRSYVEGECARLARQLAEVTR